MLSIVDIKKELGENIYLYPLTPSSIRGCSLDLRASEFGWSLKTNSRLKIDQGCLILNSNDTALIYTKESIYVSNRIGGTYHSKVGLVSSGLGHIGTTLDPKFFGQSLIAIHNHSEKDYKLEIGSEFVTIVFYYLATAL